MDGVATAAAAVVEDAELSPVGAWAYGRLVTVTQPVSVFLSDAGCENVGLRKRAACIALWSSG